uniref:Uncharacterized protein n=1 Tax=Physcomitrium patens TaxID=3218 RepID=A0A2K1IUQ2_PHYPA|nr:hypothetical protein PHYPA_024948 [Physcomitrium patens]
MEATSSGRVSLPLEFQRQYWRLMLGEIIVEGGAQVSSAALIPLNKPKLCRGDAERRASENEHIVSLVVQNRLVVLPINLLAEFTIGCFARKDMRLYSVGLARGTM